MKQAESVKNSNPKGHPHQAAMTRSVVAGSSVIALWRTMIGKKVVMAITGAVLVGFVIVHMVAISRYSLVRRRSTLTRGSSGKWVRLGWLRRTTVACPDSPAGMRDASHHRRHPTHSQSWAARPDGYTLKRDIETTFAARMMRWVGAPCVFIVFHILHFTLGAVGSARVSSKTCTYENVVAGFSVWPVAVLHGDIGALCLPLDHGIWSMLHTLGWSSTRNTRTLQILSRVVAIVVFAGFILVPVAVMAGWLR
jgi:succinate dehydrogenase / fumarate reductase cytochrome b subunit